MLLKVILCLCVSLCGIATASKADHVYVVGLFPEPVYDTVDNDQKFLPNSSVGEQSLRVKIRNPGSVSENVGFHAYLPDIAEIMSFSMSTSGNSYKAKKSDHKMADEILKKANDEDHNAAVYVPNQLPESYDDEIQSAANTVHIKGRHDITFDLLYTENLIEMVEEGKKLRNRARINLDLYGTSVEDMSAELTSPNYPYSYPNSADVAWWVRVPDGKAVSLQVNELDIEECCDRLVIYDGASIHGKIIAEVTGRIEDLTSTTHQSSTNSMFLRLVSDCSKTSTGFKVTTSAVVTSTSPMPPITTVPTFINSTQSSFQCTGTTYLYAYPDNFYYFSSPGYPNFYYDNLNCVWSIRAYYNYVVRLSVVDMDLESGYDYVYVYDGSFSNYPLLARLDGAGNYSDIYSTGEYMYVNFVTDGSVTKKGFSFQYTASYSLETTTANYPDTTTNVVSHTCGDHIELYTGSGYISSPNYPNYYYSNTQCSWYIHGHTSGSIVRLSANTLYLGNGDSVDVYDGSSYQLIRSFLSGSYFDFILYSHSSSMQVMFASDDYYQAQGFQFQYSAYYSCNEVTYLYAHTGHSHSFSSYGYPSEYYNNMDCEWRIEASYYDYVVQLHVDDMDLESCCDSVEIYDGSSSSSRMIASLTGKGNGTTYSSSGTYMFVKFVTDGSVTRKGFQFSYEAVIGIEETTTSMQTTTSQIEGSGSGSGEICTSENLSASPSYYYYIYSPNYPGYYNSNTRYCWSIYSTYAYYQISAYFYELSLASNDELVLYDGASEYYSSLAHFYNYSSRPTYYIYSSGRYMYITFTSDEYAESTGFRMQYHSV